MRFLRERVSYANVVSTVALFAALGGTSYAALQIGSGDIVNNSIRSKDIRDDAIRSFDVRVRAIRPRNIRRNSLGSEVVRESALGPVPRAFDAARLEGLTTQDLKVRCPADTIARAGVCIEDRARTAEGFLGATAQCESGGRGLPTMPELDVFARSSGPLPQAEWTASVYRNPDVGPAAVDQLEAVLLSGFGDVGYDRVYTPVQHAFRCVALPSN
jgi:hypothetical protein